MLTEQEIKKYKEEGILVLKGVVPRQKIQAYREAYERMREKVLAHPDKKRVYGARIIGDKTGIPTHAPEDDRKIECWGADFLLHPALYEPEFTDYLQNKRLISSLRDLLGPDIGIYGLKAIWSPVNASYDLTWHRDGKKEVYSKDGIPPGWLQFMTALYPEESFRVVRGSHLRPLTEEEDLKCGTVEKVGNEEICALEPGDALFMHQAVFHRGRADASTRRRAFQYILARADFPVGRRRLEQFKGWYGELKLDEKLDSTAKPLFDRFFSWEGRAFDDAEYGTKYED